MDINSRTFGEVKKAYSVNGLDLYKAVDVWLDNGLSTVDMRYAIKEDSGHTVDASFVEFLVKKAFFKDATNPRAILDVVTTDKLANCRIVKLTPAVKANIISLGNNSYTTRFSASGVEWSIIFIDNMPHLARKDFKESDVKFSEIDGNERNSN